MKVVRDEHGLYRVNVLGDQGYVTLTGFLGDDKTIASKARVKWEEPAFYDKDAKLVRYMLDNGHTSPFEHIQFNFEVKAPIFVFRQWHRHRTWSYNEISARYSILPEDFYIPTLEMIGQQSKTNKQVRDLRLEYDEKFLAQRKAELQRYTEACNQACILYNELLDTGWPRELARMVLPVSMFSKMVASVNLWNLIHFLRLRLHQHAQIEIQEYALAMLALMMGVVPYTTGLLLQEISEKPGYEHILKRWSAIEFPKRSEEGR